MPAIFSERPLPTRDPRFRAAALARQAQLTKPTGALGELERIAVWLADLQQDERPRARPAAALVFASEHPVSALGVSAYPREVTPMMVLNLAAGGAAASVLCAQLDLELHVYDVGVDAPYPAPEPAAHVQWRRLAQGREVGDLVETPAMSPETLALALEAGANAIDALSPSTRVVILGEMGIGNTTPAAALAAALLGQPADALVGPGTGVSGDVLEHKRALVERALKRCAELQDPRELLRQLGGREIAAIVGAIEQAAVRGLAVLIDGFIVSSAALAAVRMRPELADHLLCCHRSAEPGHAAIVAALSTHAAPMLDAGMRLGEGSGALVAFPLIEAAVTLHNEMATFAEAAVPDRA